MRPRVASAEMQGDKGTGAGSVPGWVRLEVGRVQHRELRPELRQFGRRGPEEHVVHEQGVPGTGRDKPHRHSLCGIGAGEKVPYEEFPLPEVVRDVMVQGVEMRLAQRLIDLAPGDVGVGARFIDVELVVGRGLWILPLFWWAAYLCSLTTNLSWGERPVWGVVRA